MIEQNTNYAYKLKYMDNPTFDKVRNLSTKFYRELPQALQDELYEALNRGIDILDSEPQMTAYLFAFGKMHQAKLNYAFDKLPKEFIEQPEINIIDYGCGQALGTMCYADFLHENGYAQKVKTITLIEPSEICLKRAALHASMFFPKAEIKTVNKKFDDLTQDDIVCNEETPTLHILSNVLDMTNFDLERFDDLVKGCLKGYNQFVCVGPYFNYSDKDDRMDDFLSKMDGEENYCETFDKYELDPEKTWTARILCASKGKLFSSEASEDNTNSGIVDDLKTEYDPSEKNVVFSTDVTKKDLEDAIEDEFGVLYSKDGHRLLRCKNRTIKEYSIKKNTKIICDLAFAFNGILEISSKSLIKIIIPNSVTKIGNHTFSECESLQQIVIPDSVRTIGNCAFYGCKSLKQITIPKSVTSLGDAIFSGCESLINTNIKSPRYRIIDKLLIDIVEFKIVSYFGNEKNIIIPKMVKAIGNYAFYCCKTLQQIFIPNSVTSIGDGAFCKCESLKEITIPKRVTNIGVGTFMLCSSLQKIIIPDSVEIIGKYAFSGCRSLSQIIIPKGYTDKFMEIIELNDVINDIWDVSIIEQ